MTRHVDSPARSPLARAFRKLVPGYPPSSMGGPNLPPPPPMAADANVTDNGERVVPEDDNFCFHAHLSIYNFAKPYVHGLRVLDAGCGTGYGSYHLLTQGKAKSVHGIDLSEKAIEFCRARYVVPGLRYDAMDLQQVSLGGRAKFDVIFSSNVLEHVADPDAFLATAIRLLAPGGVFVLGVPCVNTAEALEGNLENPYHINNITPPAWLTKMRRYFTEAQGYRHWVEPEWTKPNGDVRVDDAIRVENFTFCERSDAAMMDEVRTITTILVARGPRPHPLPRTEDEVGYPAEWNVDLGRPRGRPEGVLGPINRDREIVQTFVSEDEELSRIEIMMATYARQNRCTIAVELRDGGAEGPTLARHETASGKLIDNDWMRIEFPAITGAMGRRFALVIQSPDAGEDDTVTAYYTSAEVPGREELRVGKRDKPGNFLHFHTRWSKD